MWDGVWLLRNKEEDIPDGLTEARAWREEGPCWRLFGRVPHYERQEIKGRITVSLAWAEQ